MRTRFLIILFLFLILITVFRLFSSNPSPSSKPSFQPAFIKLNQPQNPVDQTIKKLYPEPQASLLSGILIGTRTQMPKDFFNALQKTGTLHMIALSGQNISLVISLIAFLLQGLGKKLSSVITIITIIIFILFVGPSASVVRAGIMGSLVLLSIIFGRQNLAVVGLGISGILMFVISPQILFDIGFQLSFAATLGILVLCSPPVAKSLLTDLKVTLAAQIFTFPIILFNFGNLSIVAPLTNILILWTIPILMYGGFALVLISFTLSFAEGLISPIFLISSISSWLLLPFLNWFIFIVNWTANLPFASLQIKEFSLGMAYLYYGILFMGLGIKQCLIRR